MKTKQAQLEQRRDAAKFELLLQLEQDVPERVFEGLEHIQERQRAKILEGNPEAFALENALTRFIKTETVPAEFRARSDGITVGTVQVSSHQLLAYMARRIHILEQNAESHKRYSQRILDAALPHIKRIDERYQDAVKRLDEIRGKTDERINDLRISVAAIENHLASMKKNQEFFDEYFNRVSGVAIVLGRALNSIGIPVKPETLNKLVIFGEIRVSDFIGERVLGIGKSQEGKADQILRDFKGDIAGVLHEGINMSTDRFLRNK